MRVCINIGVADCQSYDGVENAHAMRENGTVFRIDGHELRALVRGGQVVGFGIQHPAPLTAITPKAQEYLRAGVGSALKKIGIVGPVSVHND